MSLVWKFSQNKKYYIDLQGQSEIATIMFCNINDN